ncbi:TPA: hypothetical protein LA460_003376 [Clostridium botulinum]|nr:hypothetical protein [Clostridium botulinum]HBJ1655882.1 hypothetical protein [Clostridium botulinum]
MDTFLTWEYVSSFVGLVFVVGMVVEFFKEMPILKNIPTRYFTSMVAFILLLLSSIFTNTFSFNNLPLIILNAILITYTATGGHDFHYKKVNVIEDKNDNIDSK